MPNSDRFSLFFQRPLLIKLLICVIALLPLIIRLFYYPNYPGADDAFIHAAVIQMLCDHHTWGINPGEYVNMSTSPLFTVCFSAIYYLFGDVIYPGIIISSLAIVISLFLTYYIAKKMTSDSYIAIAVMALAATNVHLWRWSGTLMEVSLSYFSVLLNVLLFLFIRNRKQENHKWKLYLTQGIVLGLTVMLRPETGLIIVAFFIHDAINRRKALLSTYITIGCGILIVLSVYAVLTWSYFGNILPSTFYAKTTKGLNFINTTVANQLLQVILSGFVGLIIIIIVYAAILLFRKGAKQFVPIIRDNALFWIFPLLGFVFYYLKFPTLASPGRYFLPFMATVLFLAIPIIRQCQYFLSVNRMRSLLIAVIILQLTIALYYNHTRFAPVLSQMWDENIATMTEASEQIKKRCNQNDVVLVAFELGVISWKLNGAVHIADAGCLASPELRGMSPAKMIEKSNATYVIHSLGGSKPDYLLFGNTPLKLLWERSFKSSGVGNPNRIYYTRLYQVCHSEPADR